MVSVLWQILYTLLDKLFAKSILRQIIQIILDYVCQIVSLGSPDIHRISYIIFVALEFISKIFSCDLEIIVICSFGY